MLVGAAARAGLVCRAGVMAMSPPASASGKKRRIVIGGGGRRVARDTPILHTPPELWFAARVPVDKLPVHVDRRGARILAMLVQAATSASSHVADVSPHLHRLWKYVV